MTLYIIIGALDALGVLYLYGIHRNWWP